MEGDHYVLRFGRLKVGDAIERMSKGLEARGTITYDPALSGLPAAVRLVNFLALAKELSRLHDLDNDLETWPAQEALATELNERFLDVFESDNWWLVDKFGQSLPICGVEFREKRLDWVWAVEATR